MKRRLGTNSNPQPRDPKSKRLSLGNADASAAVVKKNESKLGKTEMSFRADFIS